MTILRYAVQSVIAILTVIAFAALLIVKGVNADNTRAIGAYDQLIGYVSEAQTAVDGRAAIYKVDLMTDVWCSRQDDQNSWRDVILSGDGVTFRVVSVHEEAYVGCVFVMQETPAANGLLLVSAGSPLYLHSQPGVTLTHYNQRDLIGYIARLDDSEGLFSMAAEYCHKDIVNRKVSIGRHAVKVVNMYQRSPYYCSVRFDNSYTEFTWGDLNTGVPVYLVTK